MAFDPAPIPPIVSPPAVPPVREQGVVAFGDSLTEQATPAYTLGFYPRRFISVSQGGMTGSNIAVLNGGLTVTANVTGSIIPASGTVALTGVLPEGFPASPATRTVIIAGVRGTVAGTTNIFTRTTAGEPVRVLNPVVVERDLSNTQGDEVDFFTTIYELGRNGLGAAGFTISALVQAMERRQRRPNQPTVVMGPMHATTVTAPFPDSRRGGMVAPFTERLSQAALNAELRDSFPIEYFDFRRRFIDGSKAWFEATYPAEFAATWGLAYQGGAEGTRAAAALGPNSDWDIQFDTIPRALLQDDVHFNAFGYEYKALLIKNRLLVGQNPDPLPIRDTAVSPNQRGSRLLVDFRRPFCNPPQVDLSPLSFYRSLVGERNAVLSKITDQTLTYVQSTGRVEQTVFSPTLNTVGAPLETTADRVFNDLTGNYSIAMWLRVATTNGVGPVLRMGTSGSVAAGAWSLAFFTPTLNTPVIRVSRPFPGEVPGSASVPITVPTNTVFRLSYEWERGSDNRWRSRSFITELAPTTWNLDTWPETSSAGMQGIGELGLFGSQGTTTHATGVSVYRIHIENRSQSGRTSAEFYAADWAASSGRFS